MSNSNNVSVKEGVSLKPSQGYLEETVPPFTPFLAMEEASRCLLCYNPPCSEGCPADTNPGDFIRAIRFRNFKGAAEIIRSNNILGGVCARVCPYEKTCEAGCERSGIDKPIQIGRLQQFVTDYEKTTNFQVLDPPKAARKKIAMIGAGPASLSAAATLAMKGYPVTIFEEKEKEGGVLSYGIVPARLPQYVVDEEVEYVTKLGVEIKLNTKVLKDITLDEIRNQGYKAIMIGAGMAISRTIDVEGLELDGVTTIPEKCSPGFDAQRKELTAFTGFKNMEQTSDKPYKESLQAMKQLRDDFPNTLIIGSIMGVNEDDWAHMARDYTDPGLRICLNSTSHALG